MKTLKFLALFLFAAVASTFAAQATFLVTFDPPPEAGPELEYVVEAQINNAWVEVARGDGFETGETVGKLGIKFSANVGFGNYTVRVYTHVKDGSIPREEATDTSAPASTMVRPGKPTNLSAFSNRQ